VVAVVAGLVEMPPEQLVVLVVAELKLTISFMGVVQEHFRKEILAAHLSPIFQHKCEAVVVVVQGR
jgi:hypothetical protein